MKNGQFYSINFTGNIWSEINKIHLGIIYTIPGIKNMVFCIPLTSPKLKHFKNSLQLLASKFSTTKMAEATKQMVLKK